MTFKGEPERHRLDAKGILTGNAYDNLPYRPIDINDYMRALNLKPIPKSERPPIFL